jgi:hypothetical protein
MPQFIIKADLESSVRKQLRQGQMLDWLGEKTVEASLSRPALVFFLTVTRDSDDRAAPARLLSPQPLRDPISAAVRKADI